LGDLSQGLAVKRNPVNSCWVEMQNPMSKIMTLTRTVMMFFIKMLSLANMDEEDFFD
jgi:hypothetical protein